VTWLRATGGPAKGKKLHRLICKQSHLCFPLKKEKVCPVFPHYLYQSTTISKNAVGEIRSVCFCKVKCLGLWNAKMLGRRENEHLYHAGVNICKYKLFSKAFFYSSGRNYN